MSVLGSALLGTGTDRGATVSKFLNEHTITSAVNDKLKINRISPSATETITLTAGRYRDIRALLDELQDQLDALSWGTWTVAVSETDGQVSIDADEQWELNWNTATYGTALRDLLGFDGTEVPDPDYTLTANNQHEGGFYPLMEQWEDDRPVIAGTDRWTADSTQSEGRSGVLSTRNGTNLVYDRQTTFLLTQADLEPFQTWLAVCATGRSFAYYHDRTEDWPGPNSEYSEYKLLMNKTAIQYEPEPIDPPNTAYFRQSILMRKRVEATP